MSLCIFSTWKYHPGNITLHSRACMFQVGSYINPFTLFSLISWALKLHLSIHTTDVKFHFCGSSSFLQLSPIPDNAFYHWWVRGVLHRHLQKFGGGNAVGFVLHIARHQLHEVQDTPVTIYVYVCTSLGIVYS